MTTDLDTDLRISLSRQVAQAEELQRRGQMKESRDAFAAAAEQAEVALTKPETSSSDVLWIQQQIAHLHEKAGDGRG